MRLRHRPDAIEKLQEHSDYVVSDPEAYKGKWHERFGNTNPIHIEIGCGKGQFIVEMAKRYPDTNFIGIELQSSALVLALEKQIEEKRPNLQFIRVDARLLKDAFSKGEVDRIHLTFSDPWPKARHEKRRLTYKTFLSIYKYILADNGELHFKTDNQPLFEYSLTSFSAFHSLLKEVYLDLHTSDVEENVMTEYEEKFSNRGSRIYKAIVKP